MCKTHKDARNDIISPVSFNTAWQIVQRKLRNWIYINELIDFGGQNEIKYMYNSNFLSCTITADIWEKSEKLICKIQSESKK